VAATVITTPLAAFHFGMVSSIALIANLLAIPAVSLAVPASAAALAVSYVSQPAARFLAAGAEISLASLDRVARASAAVPYGHFRAHPRQLLFAFGGARPLEIHMIDVGQGDGIAVRTPHGRWVVVDAGPASPTYDAGEKRMIPYLIRRGVRTIDALIITHPDLDHFGGAAALIRTLSVRAAYDPGVPVGKALYDSLLLTAERRQTQWHRVRSGTRIDVDGVQLDFLHPDTVLLDASESANDYSAVFQLRFGQFSALFLGDVSTEVEAALLRRYGDRLDVDLIKVGHHGSRTSTSAELLRHSTPVVALLSVGRRNFYRHPSPQVIERLEVAGVTLFRTDQQGNVLLQVMPPKELIARVAQ
jgi:competence protein ComEC